MNLEEKMCQRMILLVLLCGVCISSSFLLDFSTPSTGGMESFMTDDHYETLFKLICEERQARLRLQQYVLKQHNQMSDLQTRLGILEKQCNKTAMLTEAYLKNASSQDDLKDKYLQMSHQLELLKIKLENNSDTTENATIDQLKTLEQIQKQLQSVKDNVKAQENSVMNALESLDRNLKRKTESLEVIFHQVVNRSNEYVAMTACNNDAATVQDGQVMTFKNIIHSYGIRNLTTFKNSGIFTSEVEGLYLITVNVVAYSGDTYILYWNDSILNQCFSSLHADWKESSCTAAIRLSPSDRISVKSASTLQITNTFTCMTLVKIA